MAKDSSFDIVSVIDMQEVDNAINQGRKEIVNRYDLKNTNSTIELDREQNKVVMETANDMALTAILDVIKSKMIKRGISPKALDVSKAEDAAGGRLRQEIELVTGISTEKSKEINLLIKKSKLRVKTQIEGDKLRVSAKSKDLLQEAIVLVKEANVEIPLQFVNFR